MNETDFQELLKYQNMLARQVVQEAKTDRKIKLLEIINLLTKNGRKEVQTELVIHEADLQGFSENETYALIEELERDSIIRESKEGFLRRS